MADHGIAISDHDLDQGETSSSRELEAQLRERDRANEAAQREIETLNRRCLTAEDQVESLGRMIEKMNKDTRSPTAMSMRSPSPSSGDPRYDQERKIAEIENQHKEKLAALESDYQTAVRYVKGTEKMLKRMKVSQVIMHKVNKLTCERTNSVNKKSATRHFKLKSTIYVVVLPRSALEHETYLVEVHLLQIQNYNVDSLLCSPPTLPSKLNFPHHVMCSLLENEKWIY